MTDSSPRDRAAAAFGHVQQAATEMIAAARETLDLLDEALSNTDLTAVLDTLNHLSQALFTRPGSPAGTTSDPPPAAPDDATPAGRASPVQRISVR